MHRKLGILFICFGLILVVSSIGLIVYNQNEDAQAGREIDRILPRIEEIIDEKEPLSDPYAKMQNEEMTKKKIDGYDYIGYLEIPYLGLKLPIMSEWDYTRLRMSPCRYYGSTKTNDLVLAAHNYSCHFGRISTLKAGSLVVFTDLDGIVNRYTVESVEVLQPESVDNMIFTNWDLTLFTCTYGGQTRATVRCKKYV